MLHLTNLYIFRERLIQTHGSVVKASHNESGYMGSIPAGGWNSLPPLGHFVYWARQSTATHDKCTFSLHQLRFQVSINSKIGGHWGSGFKIKGWRGVEKNVKMVEKKYNGLTRALSQIRLPLFLSTWTWALDPDSATCAGLVHGRDKALIYPQSKGNRKGWVIVFPWIVENTWKPVAHPEGFSTPDSPDWHARRKQRTQVTGTVSEHDIFILCKNARFPHVAAWTTSSQWIVWSLNSF